MAKLCMSANASEPRPKSVAMPRMYILASSNFALWRSFSSMATAKPCALHISNGLFRLSERGHDENDSDSSEGGLAMLPNFLRRYCAG
eukprot:6172788-Pleurochrysis_carterae.AAC.2